MTKDVLQKAIGEAARGDLSAVGSKCFEYDPLQKQWMPRQGCLGEYYSGGEAVVASILLAFYLEVYGKPKYLEVPADREQVNSIADLIWPGAFYFVNATSRLADEAAWATIKGLLP